jgi:hypothetical protein
MDASAALVVIVVGCVGGYLGWHVRHAKGANDDLKVHKQRIPRFRKTRNRSIVITILGLVICVFVLRALFS